MQGRLERTIDGSGNVTAMEYAGASASGCSTCSGGGSGQVRKITYPTFAKEFRCDTRGSKTSEIDVLSEILEYSTAFAYDAAGNLISKTDKQGKVTTYTYDELNRLAAVTDPAGGVTHYAYDDRDNLISLRDAEGHTTSQVIIQIINQ